MLITEATGQTEDEVIASVCEYLIEHDLVPYTYWGIIRYMTPMQWVAVRPFTGREN